MSPQLYDVLFRFWDSRVRELERDLEAVRAILGTQELADGTARRAALLILNDYPRKASDDLARPDPD